mgnify:CR=1 FL=1
MISRNDEISKIPKEWLTATGQIKRSLTTRDKTLAWIFLAREAQSPKGTHYDYSKVVYVNTKTKVTIVCSAHGEFLQSPRNHKDRGDGCPKCAGKNKTQRELIAEFRLVHGHRYDYSNVVYTGNGTDISIICKTHGEFTQSPASHRRVRAALAVLGGYCIPRLRY